ncbi:ABC transporter permease [Microbispora sp. H10670]|uniref:ABC transporter permease n=1 Tax=Microbispora sp. H10670 TaxID=2729108 RepID=UPI001600BBF0|nr:ABC transporter permease [Microbispora sp. H10670]
MNDVAQAVRLARVDLTLVFRNRTAFVNAVLLPLLIAGALASNGVGEGTAGIPGTQYVMTGMMAFILVFATFMNLAGFYTSRREEMVLKRLLGGPATRTAVLGGSALGATAVYLGQVIILCVLMSAAMGTSAPADILLLLLAALLGAAFFSLLAMAVSGLSSTGEMAQIATLPVVLLLVGGSPVMLPPEMLPPALRTAIEFLPMTPIVETMRTAYLGLDYIGAGHEPLGPLERWGAALPSLGLLVVWIAVAALLARAFFRWDPRRG